MPHIQRNTQQSLGNNAEGFFVLAITWQSRPEGLLNPLTDQEIVDLFAYLETSKSNETAAAGK